MLSRFFQFALRGTPTGKKARPQVVCMYSPHTAKPFQKWEPEMKSKHGKLLSNQRLVESVGTGMPYVFGILIRCPNPECGATRHNPYGSHDQGDGSRLQYTTCKTCGLKFKVILE